MDNRRLLLAAVLSVAVLLVWQYLFPPPEPVRRPQPPAEATQPLSQATSPAGAVGASGTGGPAQPAASTAASAAEPPEEASPAPEVAPLETIAAASEERLALENDSVRVELSNRGATLVSFVLKDQQLSDGTLLELVAPRGASPYPFALIAADGAPHPLDAALFRAEREELPGAAAIRFTYRGVEGSAEKRIVLRADGKLELDVRVEGGLGPGGVLVGPGLRARTKDELASRFAQRAAVYHVAGETSWVDPAKVETPTRLPASTLDWIGLEDTYFLVAVTGSEGLAEARIEPVMLVPADADDKAAFDGVPFADAEALSADERKRPRDLRLVFVPAGESLKLISTWSAKQFDRLAELGGGLEQTIRWGWLGVIARPLLRGLQWIHGNLTPNYGWAIVLLTTALKLALLPLSLASFKSMRKMQKLNPKMQAVREKWRPKLRDKNGRFNPDAQRQMNEEVMALYRQEGVNPAGGCLPILVQLPIFFAFYRLLSSAVELWQAPWIFWIHDLTAPDPHYVLPIVMGVTQILQQRMTPPPPDPMQKRLMQFLPIVFTVFSLGFASGLVLYWLTNNVLSIAQQGLYNRIQERHEHEAAPAEKPKRKKKS